MIRRAVYFDNYGIEDDNDNDTLTKNYVVNESGTKLIYYGADAELKSKMMNKRKAVITEFANEIYAIISHDEYDDGELSRSEIYIREACESKNIEYVMDALMEIYMSNLNNYHVLEGILIMVSSIPYEDAYPKGQIMAMGLLSNKELLIRDRAIQCFERWNSKKGLKVLKNLECNPQWLQRYVDKVIMYIEKDGVD